MSIFGDLDIQGAADNPFTVPDNTYPFVVSDFEVKRNEKSGNTMMLITYKIREGEHEGFEIVDRTRVPAPGDKDILTGKKLEDAKSYIKMRLAALGVPEAKMNTVTKEDIVGIECYATTQQNGDFQNLKAGSVRLTLDDSAGAVSSSTTGADPFGI